MRRTGAVLASIAVMVLGMPAVAEESGVTGAAAGCVATALPVPPDAAEDGAVVNAILEPGTYLGRTAAEVGEGLIWRGGSSAPLEINPYAVNASGLVVGGSEDFHSDAARMQLGGTPEYSWNSTYLDQINTAGEAVGGVVFVHTLGVVMRAVWWRPGDAEPAYLPGPSSSDALAIDDLGYKIGYGTSSGERRELVWGPDGQIMREFGPFGDGDTELYLRDIDDGIALATRYQPNGAKDLVLVDVVTGAVTPLPNTDGISGELFEDGWVAGTVDLSTPVLWHNGVRYDLPPAVSDTKPRYINDLKVFGSTAVLAGSSSPVPGTGSWYLTPTIWRCS